MEDCLSSFGEADIFSIVNASLGYWQIDIDDRDTNKMTCTSPHGVYTIFRLLSNLNRAPSTFQHLMDIIQSTVKCKLAIV